MCLLQEVDEPGVRGQVAGQACCSCSHLRMRAAGGQPQPPQKRIHQPQGGDQRCSACSIGLRQCVLLSLSKPHARSCRCCRADEHDVVLCIASQIVVMRGRRWDRKSQL